MKERILFFPMWIRNGEPATAFFLETCSHDPSMSTLPFTVHTNILPIISYNGFLNWLVGLVFSINYNPIFPNIDLKDWSKATQHKQETRRIFFLFLFAASISDGKPSTVNTYFSPTPGVLNKHALMILHTSLSFIVHTNILPIISCNSLSIDWVFGIILHLNFYHIQT